MIPNGNFFKITLRSVMLCGVIVKILKISLSQLRQSPDYGLRRFFCSVPLPCHVKKCNSFVQYCRQIRLQMPFYAAGFFVYGIILGINQISLRSQFATSNLKYDFVNVREKRRELYFNENKTENSSYCLKNLSFRSWANETEISVRNSFF